MCATGTRNMTITPCRGWALAVAVLSIIWTAPASALSPDNLTTTQAAIDTEMERRIVLRSVRMPDAFGPLLLEMDADKRIIDRKREVAILTDADVWVVGLSGWSDTKWLEKSPLHAMFADHLQSTAPHLKYKSFRWNVREGRMLDVHFVNLETAGTLTTSCLAEQVYRLSHRVLTSRRVGDLSLVSPRARPLVALAAGPEDGSHCD